MNAEFKESSYAGHGFPSEAISCMGWLCYRVSLSLRMVEEMLLLEVSKLPMRLSGMGTLIWDNELQSASVLLPRLMATNGVCVKPACPYLKGGKHWLWCAVDQIPCYLQRFLLTHS